jgi:transmembrane sensor
MKKEYITYELEDLLEDKDFVTWVKEVDEKEVRSLFEFAEETQISKILFVKNLVNSVSEKKSFSKDSEAIWQQISRATKPPQKEDNIRKLYLRIAGIAASLLVGWFFFVKIPNQSVNVYSPYATLTDHVLPDGSRVTLNANSEISYGKDFKQNRELSLSGEAFFEVEKGSRFTVKTELGNVEVLGTSFNVKVLNQSFEVICKTGKVLVSNSTINKESVLTPGQKVVYNDGLWKDEVTEQEIYWKNKRQVFDNTKINHVMKSLENFYGKPFKLSVQNDSLFFSGQITLENLEKSVEELTWPFRFKYRIEKDTIYIGQF